MRAVGEIGRKALGRRKPRALAHQQTEARADTARRPQLEHGEHRLRGRDLQREEGQRGQICFTTPLIDGLDGLAIGPVIRHFFNSRHEGKGSPWWTWGVAAAGMIAVAWLSATGPRQTVTGALPGYGRPSIEVIWWASTTKSPFASRAAPL